MSIFSPLYRWWHGSDTQPQPNVVSNLENHSSSGLQQLPPTNPAIPNKTRNGNVVRFSPVEMPCNETISSIIDKSICLSFSLMKRLEDETFQSRLSEMEKEKFKIAFTPLLEDQSFFVCAFYEPPEFVINIKLIQELMDESNKKEWNANFLLFTGVILSQLLLHSNSDKSHKDREEKRKEVEIEILGGRIGSYKNDQEKRVVCLMVPSGNNLEECYQRTLTDDEVEGIINQTATLPLLIHASDQNRKPTSNYRYFQSIVELDLGNRAHDRFLN